MTDESPIPNKGQPDQPSEPIAWGQVALFGLCPKCGSRTLYTGLIEFTPSCRNCGLDFGKFNVGDGPAGFLTLIIGALMVGLALWLDFTFQPPFWVHAMIWIPVTAAAVVYGLRIGKAALLASEYHHNAHEAGSGDLTQNPSDKGDRLPKDDAK